MTAIPSPLHETVRAIYGLHESRSDRPARPYLGASVLGEECERRLWLSFRWCGEESFDGRMLRLFDTGNREEARVLEELRELGCEVMGEQWPVEAHGGHFRGHLDAVVTGLPESPKTPHLVDVKTANRKKFDELLKNGIAQTYPKYVAQGQVYMGLASLERAAFVFVCKDDDRIHLERFEFDGDKFDRLMQRASRVIFAAEPPPRISADPAWHVCKFCPFHAQCHAHAVPQPSCRSCAHVTPTQDGDWHCERHEREVSTDEQRVGCPEHRVIPILLENWAEMVDGDGRNVRYRSKLHAGEFVNGDAPQGYASAEIAAANDKRIFGEPGEMGKITHELREEFGARIVSEGHEWQDGDVVRWRTFGNGTRHLEHLRDGKWLAWAPQTPEWMARAGEPDPVADMPDDLAAVYGVDGKPADLFTQATEGLFK